MSLLWLSHREWVVFVKGTKKKSIYADMHVSILFDINCFASLESTADATFTTVLMQPAGLLMLVSQRSDDIIHMCCLHVLK